MIQKSTLSTSGRSPLVGPILCFGFMTTTLMWCAWYLTHFPGVSLPAWTDGLILLVVLWAGMTAAGIAVGGRRAPKVGFSAGLVCSLLNLLVLASVLVKQPAAGAPAPGFSGLDAKSLVFIPGFLAVGGLIGLVAAVIAGRVERTVRGQGVTVEERIASLESSDPGFWLSRLAIVAVATIAPLLLIGGGVTSTQSGMAVPGWPDSYGANMFLYPISLMTGRVYFEHTHRLFGSLAGLTILVLLVYALATPAPRKSRVWAAGLFVLVCVQGVLGALRVVEVNPYFGAVHGIIAQVFFALAIALAAGLSPLYQPGTAIAHDAGDRRRKALSTGLLHATLLQLALGAMFRHLKSTGNPGTLHILWTHAGFSLIVVILAMLAGFSLLARPNAADPIGPTIRRLGRGILAIVTLQFLLGWLAFWMVASNGPAVAPPTADQLATAPPINATAALVTTLHQANGALLLALATLAVVWTRRIWRDGRAAGVDPAMGSAR